MNPGDQAFSPILMRHEQVDQAPSPIMKPKISPFLSPAATSVIPHVIPPAPTLGNSSMFHRSLKQVADLSCLIWMASRRSGCQARK